MGDIYIYDALGRMIFDHYVDRQSAINGGEFSTTFGHDTLGRVTSEGDGHGPRSFAYDLAGNRTRLTHHDGFFVTYDYNVLGEMTAVRESGTTTLATYAYDNLGRRASLTRGNGAVTGYGYDAVSRLSSLTQDMAGTAHDLSLGFSYNPAGQIVETTRSNDAYAYTGHSNQNRSDSVNGLNQVTSSGGTAVAHDGTGNTTQIGSDGYAYTAENRLGIGGGRYFQSGLQASATSR